MTTKLWFGGHGYVEDNNAWIPYGSPQPGDTAIVSNGVLLLGDTGVPGVAFQLNAGANPVEADLFRVSIFPTESISALAAGAADVTFAITFGAANEGLLSFAGTSTGADIIQINSYPGSGTSFSNSGIIFFSANTSRIQGQSQGVYNTYPELVENVGVMALYDPSGTPKSLYDSVDIIGVSNQVGTIRIGAGFTFESAAKLTYQTVFLGGTNGLGATLELDTGGLGNAATVANFTASDKIVLTTQPYTTESLVTANGNTTLSLLNNGTVVGQVTLQGLYAANQINVATSSTASAEISVVTTTVADVAPTGPVYRFFDTATGTHFLTADTGERNALLANPGTYAEETNGFGDVIATDPNAEAVYRFFDTIHGTHFFTASLSERNDIRATRPDLVYEPNSSFTENTVALPGTVPVYRFFDTKLGTHFYTGDPAEYAGLTTQGAATYRADLTSEGVSFYAPSGSFR